MVNVNWPAIFSPTHFHYYHIDQDRSGGQSLGGGEQIVASPGARWGAKMTLGIWDTERLLAIRALRSALKGRVNPVLLPNFDRHHLPLPIPAATFRTNFPIGATDVTVNYTGGGAGPPVAGIQFFFASRMYEIEEVFDSGGVHHLSIWPPLRTAVSTGQTLQFIGSAAECLMRCMNMSEQLQQLTDLHFATLELQFEEYI
jgi:hypothetical protein